MADTVLTELIMHKFDSVEQMIQHESDIGEDDLAFTDDTSIRLPILTPMWFDHQVNDESWLNADTFSWQPADKYKLVYEHLLSDYISSIFQTETIGDITITYYLALDGHKICLSDQESNIVALYESTGVAWYYILDTANKQFKLPRTKFGFTGLRDSVGGYIAPGLPNITGTFTNNGHAGYAAATGAFTSTKNGTHSNEGGASDGGVYSLDASRSSSIYGNGDTVQPPATQMYLYFWVGAFSQTAAEQTAGLNAEMFNAKADRNLLNTTDNVDIVIESQLPTADNGYTWYRKYKSGWVEQGGQSNNTAQNVVYTVTMPVPMSDANYTAMVVGTVGGNGYIPRAANRTATTFELRCDTFSKDANPTAVRLWYVCGMAA